MSFRRFYTCVYRYRLYPFNMSFHHFCAPFSMSFHHSICLSSFRRFCACLSSVPLSGIDSAIFTHHSIGLYSSAVFTHSAGGTLPTRLGASAAWGLNGMGSQRHGCVSGMGQYRGAVSYTHLTLPTIYSV